MSQYEYLVVPFIGQLKRDISDIETARKVSEQLQATINQHAEQGWEFYRVDKVNIQIAPGCLGTLTGVRASLITFDQVIFRRPSTQAE